MTKNEYRDEMTPKERFEALLAGRPQDRVLCNPMMSAHAARVTGIKISEYYLSAEKMAEAQIAAYKTYGHDSVDVSAILGIVHALGGDVVYLEQGSPYITGQLIKNISDLDRLPPLDIKNEYLVSNFEAAKILVDKVGNEVPVR